MPILSLLESAFVHRGVHPVLLHAPALSSCSIRLQLVPGHLFLPEIDAADELAKRGALLAPSAIPCSLSSLISRIYSCLFSDWRRTVSSKFFDTQVPSTSTEELVMLAVSSLVYAATDTALFYAVISLGLAESKILPAAPADTRPRTPLISFCTVQLRTLYVAHSLATLRPLVQTLGSCAASGAPWSSAMPPSHARGWVNNNKRFFKSLR